MNEWIPCSEQLPNEEGEYIVTRKLSDHTTETTAGYFMSHSKHWVDPIEWYEDYDVIAWQPLPEPYREV